jgi:hypothetical protein
MASPGTGHGVFGDVTDLFSRLVRRAPSNTTSSSSSMFQLQPNPKLTSSSSRPVHEEQSLSAARKVPDSNRYCETNRAPQ